MWRLELLTPIRISPFFHVAERGYRRLESVGNIPFALGVVCRSCCLCVSWGLREAWREAGGGQQQVVAHTSSVSVDERDVDVGLAEYKYSLVVIFTYVSHHTSQSRDRTKSLVRKKIRQKSKISLTHYVVNFFKVSVMFLTLFFFLLSFAHL